MSWILFFNSGAGPQYSLMWTVQGLTLWCKILICIFLKINFYARLWLCKGYCILVSQTQQADAEIKKTPKHGLLTRSRNWHLTNGSWRELIILRSSTVSLVDNYHLTFILDSESWFINVRSWWLWRGKRYNWQELPNILVWRRTKSELQQMRVAWRRKRQMGMTPHIVDPSSKGHFKTHTLEKSQFSVMGMTLCTMRKPPLLVHPTQSSS